MPMTVHAHRPRLQPDRPRRPARRRDRPRRRRVVPHRHPPQGDEGADAARGRPGDPRHHPLARALRRLRRPRDRALAVLVGGDPALRLRHALRLDRRLALARVRPRHRLQDPLDERRRLPDRLLHDHARARDLALVAHPPPHRHHHRRPRPGDRGDAAAGDLSASSSTSSAITNVLERPGACIRHAFGRLTEEEKTFVPEMRVAEGLSAPPASGSRSTSCRSRSRSALGSWLPVLLVGPLPTMYGAWFSVLDRASPSTPASPRTCSTTG